MLAVGERQWKLDREALLASLDESRAEPELRLRELRAHDRIRSTRLPAVRHALTIPGALDVIDTACKAHNVSVEKVTDGLDDDALVNKALLLINADLSPDAKDESNAGE